MERNRSRIIPCLLSSVEVLYFGISPNTKIYGSDDLVKRGLLGDMARRLEVCGEPQGRARGGSRGGGQIEAPDIAPEIGSIGEVVLVNLVPLAEADAGADSPEDAELPGEEPLEPDGGGAANLPRPGLVLGVVGKGRGAEHIGGQLLVEVSASGPVGAQSNEHRDRAFGIDVAREFARHGDRVEIGRAS